MYFFHFNLIMFINFVPLVTSFVSFTKLYYFSHNKLINAPTLHKAWSFKLIFLEIIAVVHAYSFHHLNPLIGNQPPALVPNRGEYMKKDVPRNAKYFDVPLKIPKNVPEMMFVKGSLAAQRFLTAVDMKKTQFLEKVSRELWMRNWSRDEDITEPQSLAEAGKKAGLSDEDLAVILPMIKDEAVKSRLKATTKEAFDLGAFGSPMIVAEINGQKEWVFGSDRFPILAQMIGEKWEGPVPPGVSSKL